MRGRYRSESRLMKLPAPMSAAAADAKAFARQYASSKYFLFLMALASSTHQSKSFSCLFI